MQPTNKQAAIATAVLTVLAVLFGLVGLVVIGSVGAAHASTSDRGWASDAGQRGEVQLVSLAADGTQGADGSSLAGTTPVASSTGGSVVFWTKDALVPEDTNGLADVYMRSVDDGATFLVSTGPDGELGNGHSHAPSVSANGQFVAFTTAATNLVDEDSNDTVLDVVVKNTATGKTVLASRTSLGDQRSGNSFSPVLAGNGRVVAFQTFSSFAARDQDRREDIYVHQLGGGKTRHISANNRGEDLPAHYLVGGISHNGSKVSFGDDNTAWLRDVRAGRSTRVWHEGNHPSQPGPGGTVGRPMVSGNGKFVVFSTRSSKPVDGDRGALGDVFRVNLTTNRIIKVSTGMSGAHGNDESYLPSVSHSGRYVAFVSDASNLVRGDRNAAPDVFWRDLKSGKTIVASTGPTGTGNSWSGRNGTAITAAGNAVVFRSYASDLVPADTNIAPDVFLWRSPRS